MDHLKKIIIPLLIFFLACLPTRAIEPTLPGTGELQMVAEAQRKLDEELRPLRDAVETARTLTLANPNDPVPIKQLAQAEAALKAETDQIRSLRADLQKKQRAVEEAANNQLRPENDGIYKGSLALLTMLFVLAVVLENALEIIFRWRVFRAYLSLRGVKAPIMIAAASLMVWHFHLDIVANLVALYKTPEFAVAPSPQSTWFSKIVTAFTLAGGSAGVNNLMVALGLRKKAAPETVPQPPAKMAWVAIRLKRARAAGGLLVHLKEVSADLNDDTRSAADAPVVGTIQKGLGSARELLVRSPNRFPQNGGYTVEPGKVYMILVSGQDERGEPLEKEIGPCSFSSGAIADFEVTL